MPRSFPSSRLENFTDEKYIKASNLYLESHRSCLAIVRPYTCLLAPERSRVPPPTSSRRRHIFLTVHDHCYSRLSRLSSLSLALPKVLASLGSRSDHPSTPDSPRHQNIRRQVLELLTMPINNTESSFTLTSLSGDTVEGTPSRTETEPRKTYSQAVSRSSSPGPVVRECSTPVLGARDDSSTVKGENISSAPFTKAPPSEHAPETSGGGPVSSSVKVEDDDGGGWTRVLRKKSSREGMPAKEARSFISQGVAVPAPTKSSLKKQEPATTVVERDSAEMLTFNKGKTVDPRNWGAVDIDPEELDPHAQQRELAKYGAPPQRVAGPAKWQIRDPSGAAVDDSDSEEVRYELERVPSHDELPMAVDDARKTDILRELERLRRELEQLELRSSAPSPGPKSTDVQSRLAAIPPVAHIGNPAEAIVSSSISAARAKGAAAGRSGMEAARNLRPMTQVEPNSYLGHAFRDLAERHGVGKEPSEPSSSDSSSSDDDGAGNRNKSDAAKQKKHKYREKLRERTRELAQLRKAGSSKAPVLKPREPTPYSGVADVRTFHKFVQEITAFSYRQGL
ncbi:hypothetical protein OH77DRAFT_894654 [Trametes cingulata]|nr:hypothetical protein OH77DRAFT_894654 [Trametes cingulata]